MKGYSISRDEVARRKLSKVVKISKVLEVRGLLEFCSREWLRAINSNSKARQGKLDSD